MKKLVYFLVPIQIIILLLAPRFDWCFYGAKATFFTYKGVAFEEGAIHCLYESQDDVVDISYDNPFSKKFTITFNDSEKYYMEVKIDGACVGPAIDEPPGIAADIVWKDTYGIMFWRCILTITMTLISMKLFRHAYDGKDTERKVQYAGAGIIYIIAILISLRVIF